ncbi:ATP-binding protein [Lentzea sp. HUAS TT2]|uniref:ATP-binding protein n=1 Tax=Lentzea sp. HUAS TT2 TaxID=3447454 RepID=UPI003F6F2FA2
MQSNEVANASGTVVQAGTIRGDIHVHSAPVTPVPRQLPALPRGFTGRGQVIAAIDDATADASPDTVPVVVLSGMGGVGKTATAVAWARAAAERFPGGQLYVDLRGHGPEELVSPGEALAGFLRALGVAPERTPLDTGERAATFRSLVAGRGVLVVLDNAQDAEQIRPLLPGPGSAVVVTSRRPLNGLVVEQGAVPVPVDLLSEEESLALLRTLVGRRVEEDPSAAAELVRLCARLPLALRVVAGRAQLMPGRPLTELVDTLADTHNRLDSLDVGDPRTAVRTVFSWSYERLPADQARVFRLLGLVPGATTSRRAVTALAALPAASAERALTALTEAQLVTESADRRIGMHDLLRVYATELVEQDDPDTRSDAGARLFDHYLHAAEQADRLLTPNRFRIPLDGRPRETPDLPDRAAALRWLTAEQDVLTGLCQLPDVRLDTRRWQLAYTLRGFFFLTKNWEAWVRTHELALYATERLGDRAAEASTRNNLGAALLERGTPAEAEHHYQVALRIFEELGDLRGAGNARGNLAWVLHDRGDHAGALEQLELALEHYRRCNARTNAGITLRGMAIFEAALGRYEEATTHLYEAMEIFEERSSVLNMVMALNSLGEVRTASGDPRAADEAYERAITLARSQGSTFETARAHRGRGKAAVLLDERDRAMVELRAAFELFTELSAPETAEVAAELAALDS